MKYFFLFSLRGHRSNLLLANTFFYLTMLSKAKRTKTFCEIELYSIQSTANENRLNTTLLRFHKVWKILLRKIKKKCWKFLSFLFRQIKISLFFSVTIINMPSFIFFGSKADKGKKIINILYLVSFDYTLTVFFIPNLIFVVIFWFD